MSPRAAPRRRTKPRKAAGNNVLRVSVVEGQTNAEAVAAKIIGPANRHGAIATVFPGALIASLPDNDRPGMVEYAWEHRKRAEQARGGDLTQVGDLLVSQALTLDGMFTELARRAADNMEAGYLPAFEIYMRQALKAQSASRQAIEALARLHQPREQTVRHVHVNEGGQAIVAEEFHHHAGGSRNGKAAIQSHEPGAEASGSAPMLSDDTARDSVPVPEAERAEAVPVARRVGGRT